MASIYIPVTYPSSQMLGLGFLRPTLHGNWLVKAMWEICLTYSLGLIILLWILRRIRNYSLSNVLATVVFGLSLEVIELTSLFIPVTVLLSYLDKKFNDLLRRRLLRMEKYDNSYFLSDSTSLTSLVLGYH